MKHNFTEVKSITSDEMKHIQNIMEQTQRLQENWEKIILNKSVKNNLIAADVRAKCRLLGEDLSDLLAILPKVGGTHHTFIRANVNERRPEHDE